MGRGRGASPLHLSAISPVVAVVAIVAAFFLNSHIAHTFAVYITITVLLSFLIFYGNNGNMETNQLNPQFNPLHHCCPAVAVVAVRRARGGVLFLIQLPARPAICCRLPCFCFQAPDFCFHRLRFAAHVFPANRRVVTAYALLSGHALPAFGRVIQLPNPAAEL